ncbi:metal-dependent protein hydrolase [Saccharata proteae CBS 121410]|uniref:Metal-dependent protein hydrolase n=1 Tax=Saccharata proteae CBS 121410 TaxID=1314787 RepID=A0A9P4HU83_9PEZI|nr:metal-dependent protein hydrolase [Saccharata proteae CBS 121410]
MTSVDHQSKRLKMSGPLIGTHNGHFHADEALAVYLLRTLPTYTSSPLVRTRDPEVLDTCHTVVDVGGVYDDAKKRYDHHQREFTTTFPNHSTKLSSAGLVYMHFGKEIIAQQTGLAIDSNDVEILYQKLYDDLIEAFDANDNGVSQYDTKALGSAGIQKRFEDRGFSIASVVNRYNYHFDADAKTKAKEQLQKEEDERFLKASAFCGEQFIMELTDKASNWLPARAQVKAAFDERKQYEPEGRIMVLKEGMPWADHLYSLEKESNTPASQQVLYVLFPENTEPDSKWRIRSVSVEGGGFDNRKDLPNAWKGLRDDVLSETSGIPGGVFVHASGFIGGNKTYDGALKMAQAAVAM